MEKYVQKQVILTIAVTYKRVKLDALTKINLTESSKYPNLVKNIIESFKTDNTQLVTIFEKYDIKILQLLIPDNSFILS